MVEVGSQDVRLLREIGSTPNDVILARRDSRYKCHTIGIYRNLHLVAHGNGVGCSYPFDAEITLNFTVEQLSGIIFHDIPTTGVSNNQSFHASKLMKFIHIAAKNGKNYAR